MRTEMIQIALGEGAAEGADSATVAGSTVQALTLLIAELRPLIGMLALHALYRRSIHLANSSFERPSTDLASPDELLANLHRNLVSKAPADARSAAMAVLLALANLLVSLIGEHLTNRLLQKAWGNLPLPKSSEVKLP